MNSPPDPGSPSLSTTSTESPPPEESGFQPTPTNIMNIANQLSPSFSGVGGSSKRRLPTGSSFAASVSNRDAKTRRRGEPGRKSDLRGWEGGKEGGKKDELLDHALVEYLRSEIGDPFLF